MIRKLAGIFALTVTCVFAQQPPYAGTIFDFPDSFTDEDPTALTDVTYVGREQKNVFDRRVGRAFINAYVYTASFSDGSPAWSISVNPEFSQAEAKALAEKYAHNIGQMPISVRNGISGAVIHDGNNLWGGGDPLTIHHGQGLNYERQGIVTETMIHEATHAAFDREYYNASWREAAEADGRYISTYARDYPAREDHAESFLCWLVAKYKTNRISEKDYSKITTSIPNRLKWYDGMDFGLSPVVGATTILAYNDGSARSGPVIRLSNRHGHAHSGITIGYEVDKPSRIALQILDMNGRVIRTLVRERANPGSYRKVWDAHNDAGQRVSGGAYVYRLIAGGFVATQTMVLPK